jgi:DNA-binding MarR family transcriptional regulator/GNAT superfamily N-acetyltransferase
MDILSELGELALASRLRRLSERLMKDVSRIYKELDIDFEARWFPLLYALSRHSPMPITLLADSLSLTHPAVNQLAGEMLKHGLLRASKDRKDERKRLLRLSPKGREILGRLEPVWELIRQATGEVLSSTEHDVLQDLDAIEKQLDDQDMYSRIVARLQLPPPSNLEIVNYRPALKKHFERLNHEWLTQFFEIEPPDKEILKDPNGKIIRRGGTILFAVLNGNVVGTCALIKHGEDMYELAKMAVTKDLQGRRIGRRLAEAIIERARREGARSLYLQTNPGLLAANHLYRKLNFRTVKSVPWPTASYRRETIAMRLDFKQK